LIAIANETYITLPKGPLPPSGNHVLVIPVTHAQNRLELIQLEEGGTEIVNELDGVIKLIQNKFQQEGYETFVWEAFGGGVLGGHMILEVSKGIFLFFFFFVWELLYNILILGFILII